MKKLFVLISAALLSISVIGQNQKNHPGFSGKISKQKELSVPGISDKFLKFQVQNKSAKQYSQLKEAEALKQRLDSIVSPGSEKDLYVYDVNGNLLQDTYFDWDGATWVKSWKDEYAYDFNGNQTQDISYEWDGNQWVNSEKNENSYDSHGNRVKLIYSDWNGSKWLNYYKEESVYDDENNLTQNISYQWSDLPDDMWIASSKNEFVYDLNGNQTQNISYYWQNGLWEKMFKTEFVFNTNDKITQSFEYGWDGENWVVMEKYESFYDDNENITEYVLSEWNGIAWVEAAKYTYEYDASGNMTLSNLIYFLEDQNIVFLKEESVYDDYGNNILYSYFTIDFESEEFVLLPVMKQEYVYDNNFTFEDLILPFIPEDFESDYENDFEGEPGQQDLNQMFKHKLIQLTYFEGEGDSWQEWMDYTIYYSEQNITNVNDLNDANTVNVYPNPASNQVTFSIDGLADLLTIELYDIQGKLVLSKTKDNNSPVSIETLDEGLYFYRLSDKSNFYTGKFMVK